MFRIDHRSLRFRLLTWLCGAALVVVGTTWLLHGILLNDLARDFLGERLRQEAEHVVQVIRQDRALAPPLLDSVRADFQVFHHLYVLRLDGEISTSHPHWRETLAPYLDEAESGLIEVDRQAHRLLLYRLAFRVDGEPGVLLIGEDYAPVQAGLATLHWWVGGIAGLLLVLLVTFNLLAVNLGLGPLARLRQQLHQLQAGNRERLQLDAPSELDELVAQLNHFMDEIDRRLARSRDSVANLSHALKTPLAAMTQVLQGGRPIDDVRRGKLLQRLETIHAQLESELRRSRIAGPRAGQATALHQESKRLVEMFRGLYPETSFHLAVSGDDQALARVESQDFAEMLGIVLDNAGKWANHAVTCRIAPTPDALTIRVEDDGPGVPTQELARLGQRGLRLDEGRPGHGLGLAILRQLVVQYGGELRFGVADAGGLRVEITLPQAPRG